MKSIRFVALAGALALGLAACSGGGAGSGTDDDSTSGGGDAGDQTIGVAMPTETSERWIADGNAVKSQLEEAGYSVDLQYAADDIPTQ
ncbi:MAG TPA: sugar ABC transporter substrate-binding protein, partial [Cellulomonas sp.]